MVAGHDHNLAPGRDGQLQPAAGQPESEKRRGRGDRQRRQAAEHLHGGAAKAGARRGNLHLGDRQHRSEILSEITQSERPEPTQRVFNTEDDQNHDRAGKTASE
ncbi:relaxase, partial [Enterobacter cloacae]